MTCTSQTHTSTLALFSLSLISFSLLSQSSVQLLPSSVSRLCMITLRAHSVYDTLGCDTCPAACLLGPGPSGCYPFAAIGGEVQCVQLGGTVCNGSPRVCVYISVCLFSLYLSIFSQRMCVCVCAHSSSKHTEPSGDLLDIVCVCVEFQIHAHTRNCQS
jgi:hypothetical protein